MTGFVYVSNEPLVRDEGSRNLRPLYNFADALRYGELRHLTQSGMLPSDENVVAEMIARNMPSFTDRDYLLLVGSPIAMALATMRAARLNSGRINLLVWHRMSRTYQIARLHEAGLTNKGK